MGLPAWYPTRDVGRTLQKLVNHEPKASDLQSFLSVVTTSQVHRGPFEYFRSIFADLWKAKRPNIRTLKLVPCERRSTQRWVFSVNYLLEKQVLPRIVYYLTNGYKFYMTIPFMYNFRIFE